MKQVTSVGPYGAKVTILQRKKGGRYVLRWTDPMTGKLLSKTTDFVVLTKAKDEALDKSKELLAARSAGPSDGSMTWGELLRYYEEHFLPLQEGKRQYKLDQHCLAVWRAFLPAHEAVDAVEEHVLLNFLKARRAGSLKVEKKRLKPGAERAAAMELEWLRRVVNIALRNNKKIKTNPIKLVKIPKNTRPLRPAATWDRYEVLRPACEKVGGQNIFGGFLDLQVGLGWRVTAIACLHVDDIDRTRREDAPNGRVLKRAEFDKMGIEAFVPIPNWLVPRIDELLARRRALEADGPWLFPAPTDASKHWTKDYVKERQEVAERKAGLTPIVGGDAHPWRRMWANLRKHLPIVDVAYAGCWDVQTLIKHYQQADEKTVLDVMNGGLPE